MSERATYTATYTHAFDQKGRITVPSEWREAPFEQSLTIMPTEDKYLRVYPDSWLSRKQASLEADSKSTEMQYEQLADLASSSQSTSLDAQGRIVIKADMRERAGLPLDAKAMVVFVEPGPIIFRCGKNRKWKKRAIALHDASSKNHGKVVGR